MTNNMDHRTVNLISERAGSHRAKKKKYHDAICSKM